MLSGGSSFSILEFVSETVLGVNITVTVLDERFSTEASVHNFTQLERTSLYLRGTTRGVHTISTRIHEGDTKETLRNRWEEALIAWKKEHQNGIIIATMGIGPDGHTAGIFAGDFGVDFSGEQLVVSYTVPRSVNIFTDRITVTFTFLKNFVDKAIVYVVGSGKRVFVEKIEAATCDLNTMPACILNQMCSVTLYTEE
jgi:6-phosphogluconolactonase/glucosamine-6-phosphate isomerase/deaminase